MNIHEYQAKELFRDYGIPVPEGQVAHTEQQALSIAERLGGDAWAVKAQVHTGGRGKGGGVKLAHSLDEVETLAEQIIGMNLVTAQTGNNGRLVRRVLVEQVREIEREFYLGITIDRATQRISFIVSAVGGMDIENLADDNPDLMAQETVDPAVGLQDFQCRKLVKVMGLEGAAVKKATRIMKRLYRLFRDKDGLMVEINPLALLENGDLLALDAKMTFDGNSLYRLPDITDLRDFDEEDPKEVEATGHGLNYIALNGDVGCIVNGAGLAMATMDAISLQGGKPANFLDVGGGASPEKIANAFRIVLEDPNVKTILLNIFAGINRCDWIAKGIVQAIRDQEISMPVIIRLAGTNVEEGWKIMRESGLDYIEAETLNDAAEKAVKTIKGAQA
ncbi:MAG TPA: ADP-forming succinate--CoA ligase subunit beta [Chromatiales bacterium]|nr:ADP-forming succinate--CoA ligase subunit beta [Thiotrichales bacterium]HIP69633.1 ADP-forming succinate--CoA ligase subunit beta [Chromatiales bacterium]